MSRSMYVRKVWAVAPGLRQRHVTLRPLIIINSLLSTFPPTNATVWSNIPRESNELYGTCQASSYCLFCVIFKLQACCPRGSCEQLK